MTRFKAPSELQRKRSLHQRMVLVQALLLLIGLVFVARLIELQVIRGTDYNVIAHQQQFGGVTLTAKRGEILSRNSKTDGTSILATNSTLDLVYVDPLITDDPIYVAETLADTLVTEEFHRDCTQGLRSCPRELIPYYTPAFDPMERVKDIEPETLFEPLPTTLPEAKELDLPDITEVRRRFARKIEDGIREKRVTFVPLVYGADKIQMSAVEGLNIAGVTVDRNTKLIYANPEEINQSRIPSTARRLADHVEIEHRELQRMLRSRPLRYIPVMNRLPPSLSLAIKELFLQSLEETQKRRAAAPSREAAQEMHDPLRSVALIAEHWRFYPDTTVGSHVVGFLNTNQEAQYGIERTYHTQLRGQDGKILTVRDPQGGQVLTAEQTIVDAEDGDTIIMTIDRLIQKQVETILERAVEEYDADSAQAIIMEPFSGRIVAMANAPLFDSNDYGSVYVREPLILDERKQKEVVVEIYHPETNKFVIKAFIDDLFTEEGRTQLTEQKQAELEELETLYDLRDITRYYLYIGENSRREIFPTERPEVWLKYENNIGVGAYLNRTVQEIYEPGSVLKPVTMAIAIDQGEILPDDTYDDAGPVKVDEYTIRNALLNHFGIVTMTNCLEYSINTCMTSVSTKLGKKLFHRMLLRFGFGSITGIELEDELPGEILPWRKWSNALLATAAYGQGISATPLQVVTAFGALANGGKLMRPTIVDSIIDAEGVTQVLPPHVVDQVITPDTSATITAMLTSTVTNGYAKTAKVPGYRIAGKTGTSQIAGPGGKYETGTGASITSFAGYAPIDQPKFVMLIKIDRPRNVEYGSESAAPVFKEIAAFLFEYYGVPPDEL